MEIKKEFDKRKIHCVYIHYNKVTGEPFYVGEGRLKRATSKHSRSYEWSIIVSKFGYEIEIVSKGLTKQQACIKEMELISEIGRRDLRKGPLVNLTDGDKRVTNLGVIRTKKELCEILEVNGNIETNTSIIHTGTKQIFESITKAAESINMNPNTLEYFLNNPETINTTYFQYLN